MRYKSTYYTLKIKAQKKKGKCGFKKGCSTLATKKNRYVTGIGFKKAS